MARPVKPALGAALQLLRIENGLSQADLAERASVHITMISNIERGQRSPVWATVEALITGLGVSYTELVQAIDRQQD